MSDSASTDVNAATGKQEWVYTDLRTQLESGRRKPGDRLVIAQLAEEFGVSAIPVREAIRRLEAEGWITFRPNVGAEVVGLSREAWADAVEVLAVIEGQATALAAPHLTAADIDALRALNARMATAVRDRDEAEFIALNRSFHALFRVRCQHSWFSRMLEEMQPRFDALGPGGVTPRSAAAVAEHAELIELIAGGADAALIEAAARRHKLNTAGPYR